MGKIEILETLEDVNGSSIDIAKLIPLDHSFQKISQLLVWLARWIWAIHCCNFSGNRSPLHLSFDADILLVLLYLLPFQKFIHESAVGLDNDIQAACAYKTAIHRISIFWFICVVRRETHYARGRESPSALITSAMQIVAERETPTRQWTSVGSPFRRPSSKINVSCNQRHEQDGILTNKIKAPPEVTA